MAELTAGEVYFVAMFWALSGMSFFLLVGGVLGLLRWRRGGRE